MGNNRVCLRQFSRESAPEFRKFKNLSVLSELITVLEKKFQSWKLKLSDVFRNEKSMSEDFGKTTLVRQNLNED